MNCLPNLFVVLVCLWTIMECCFAVRFMHFEEFLMNHRHEQTTPEPMETQPSSSGSWEDDGSGDDFLLLTTTTLSPVTLPRTRMTCCELGKLAGKNNFECNPNNYGPEIHERNPNRPYGNFKRNRPSNRYAFTQVKQFSKCISGHVRQLAFEFQRCCKHAYREQLHQQRRDEMMLQLPIAVHDNNKPSRTIFHIEREDTDSSKIPAVLGVQLAEDDQQGDDDNSRTTSPNKKHHNTKW